MKWKIWNKLWSCMLSCLMAFATAFSVGACVLGNGGDSSSASDTPAGFTELTYIAFGDSITWGEVGATQEQMEKPYPVLVAEDMGFKAVKNYGQRNASVKYMQSKPNVITQVSEAVKKADIVSVMIGINDFGAGCQLGTMQDTSCTESVYGGFNQLASSLKSKYPDAFIFIMTPLKPFDWAETNKAGYTLVDMSNAIKEVCAANDFAVLDLNATSEFSSQTDPYCPDGLHPSQYYFTNYMVPKITQFIRANYNK